MICPMCGNKRSQVVDSRPNDEEVMRRRVCLNCRAQWITQERLVQIFKPKKERS